MSYFLDFGEFDLGYLVDLHLRLSGQEMADLACVRAAGAAGLRAVLLRSQTESSYARAGNFAQAGGRLSVAGVFRPGGMDDLEDHAIETALAGGVKLVDLSVCSSCFEPDGSLSPGFSDALEHMIEVNVILATGELPEEKTIAVVQAAQQMRLRRILVPAGHRHSITQAGLQGEGVFLEWDLAELCYPADPAQIAALANGMRQAGIEASVIASGLGAGDAVTPVDALSHFLAALAAQGMPLSELKQMAGRTPGYLLDLPERVRRKPDK